ncbi:MAG: hypothetical protein J6F30_01740, partial [Cellulosilyticum sp.]|nr:hypothetical protein [Cellulosilyticum sp.]
INFFYDSSHPVWIQPEGSYEIGEVGYNKEVSEHYYELTQTEKLNHIKPVIEYTLKGEYNKGDWQLRIKLR